MCQEDIGTRNEKAKESLNLIECRSVLLVGEGRGKASVDRLRGRPMKGKPILVAVASFVIVLLGGAAFAGVGTQWGGESETTVAAAHVASAPVTIDVPEWETTRTSAEKVTPAVEPVEDKKHEEEAKEEKSEEKDEQPKTEEIPDVLFSITHPEDGTHVTKKVVAFGGAVADGVSIHRGKYEAKQEGGEWWMELVLSPGKNRVAFEAIHTSGESATAAVTVYYDAPVEEPKEKPKEETQTEFTAHQKYGSCGEEIPYDVFYGTAKPGAKIIAVSPYGGNSTTANDDGHWEMKVKFPESPYGKAFEVVIESTDGGRKVFGFVNTGSEGEHGEG